MSSATTTPNLGLPQWVAAEKPERTDFNAAFLALDAKAGWTSVLDVWSYLSADAPTFVVTVPTDATTKYSVGMRIRLTQTTVKYFIITAITATTMTLYGGTDYTIANAAISAISFSSAKAPYGFPVNPAKWMIEVTDSTNRTQANPVSGTVYNINGANIIVPIGAWIFELKQCGWATRPTAGTINVVAGISTAPTTQPEWVMKTTGWSTGITGMIYPMFIRGVILAAAKTTYYLVCSCFDPGLDQIGFYNGNGIGIIRLVCAYL